MKAVFLSILSLLALASCASPAPTADALMRLPADSVFEARHSAAAPAAIAYKNILERAQICWQRNDRVVDADSFRSDVGTARISLKRPAQIISPALVLVVVEVSGETPHTSRLVGRSLVASSTRITDLQNLRLWAEGKKPACAPPPGGTAPVLPSLLLIPAY